MELSTIKEFFFVGEQNEIDEFCSELSARCLRSGGEFDVYVDGETTKKHLLVYAKNGDTLYLDAHRRWYQECPVCHRIEPCESLDYYDIWPSQRRNNGPRTRRRESEVMCSECASEQLVSLDCSYDLEEYGLEDGRFYFLFKDDPSTFCILDEDHEGNLKKRWFIGGTDEYRDACSNTLVIMYRLVPSAYNDSDVPGIERLDDRIRVKQNLLGFLHYPDASNWYLKRDLEACELVSQCQGCGEWFLNCDLSHGYCPECNDFKVYSYHDWPGTINFKTSENDEGGEKMFFGIEIETVGSRDNRTLVAPYRDIWHLEADSSIGSNGFEMISQPMTFNYIKENYEKFKEMFEALVDAGQKSHEDTRCGFHIHVSKAAFDGERAIKRAVAIVHALQYEMEKFGRRRNNRYYQFTRIPENFTESDFRNIDLDGHYTAVNTHQTGTPKRKKTVEFRFPKGTLNPVTFMATIEFIRNIVKMANSDRLIVKFGDLIEEGEFIPEYIQARAGWGITFDKDAKVAFARVRLDGAYINYINNLADPNAYQHLTNQIAEVSTAAQALQASANVEGGAA